MSLAALEPKHEEDEDHEITNFILKVWGMVENPEYNNLISWTPVRKYVVCQCQINIIRVYCVAGW